MQGTVLVADPNDTAAQRMLNRNPYFPENIFIFPGLCFGFGVIAIAAGNLVAKIFGALVVMIVLLHWGAFIYGLLGDWRQNRMIRKGRILEISYPQRNIISKYITGEMNLAYGTECEIYQQVFGELRDALDEYWRARHENLDQRLNTAEYMFIAGQINHGFSEEIKRVFANLQISAVELVDMRRTNARANAYGYYKAREA